MDTNAPKAEPTCVEGTSESTVEEIKGSKFKRTVQDVLAHEQVSEYIRSTEKYVTNWIFKHQHLKEFSETFRKEFMGKSYNFLVECRRDEFSIDSKQAWFVTWSTYSVDECLASQTIQFKQTAVIATETYPDARFTEDSTPRQKEKETTTERK